jgi:hypothetical protein
LTSGVITISAVIGLTGVLTSGVITISAAANVLAVSTCGCGSSKVGGGEVISILKKSNIIVRQPKTEALQIKKNYLKCFQNLVNCQLLYWLYYSF